MFGYVNTSLYEPSTTVNSGNLTLEVLQSEQRRGREHRRYSIEWTAAMDEDSDIENNDMLEISSSEAVDAFNKAIIWSERNIFNTDDLLVLRKCRDKALQKSLATKKIQKQITQYFPKL